MLSVGVGQEEGLVLAPDTTASFQRDAMPFSALERASGDEGARDVTKLAGPTHPSAIQGLPPRVRVAVGASACSLRGSQDPHPPAPVAPHPTLAASQLPPLSRKSLTLA